MEYSYHSLILLVGFAVAGLALFAAVAVGPYGRRGVRVTLALLSFVAFLGSAGWLLIYLGWIDQRNAIEARLTELRAQALSAGSTLACLERTGETVEGACAQTLFAAPETLAAANVYTAAQLDQVIAAARYTGPRTGQFRDAVRAVRRSLQQDPFGLTANILVRREGCTAERCDAIGLFSEPARLWENIRQKTFDTNVARHAANWRAPGAAAPAPAAGIIAPTGGETRAPIPDKYTLPSSASIPPVSIMTDEPARPPAPPAAPKDRPAALAPAVAATPPAERPSAPPPEAAQPAPPRPAAPKQQRRETARPSAPLSITPKQ